MPALSDWIEAENEVRERLPGVLDDIKVTVLLDKVGAMSFPGRKIVALESVYRLGIEAMRGCLAHEFAHRYIDDHKPELQRSGEDPEVVADRVGERFCSKSDINLFLQEARKIGWAIPDHRFSARGLPIP